MLMKRYMTISEEKLLGQSHSRIDVPEQYQVSLSDISISQAIYDEAVANGGNISTKTLSRSKAMMFEDLVLQSIKYDGDTITLTVPDYLPESQRWVIGIAYWDDDKDYNFMNNKHIAITEPGEYTYSGIKLLQAIGITVKPQNSDEFTSHIRIDYQKNLSLERYDNPIIDFNNAQTTFDWVQGQGYKDYFKDYTFDENKYEFELSW